MIYEGMPITLLSQSDSYFKWTLDRGIFTRACDIHAGMDSATIEWILHRNAPHLSWLSCHNFDHDTSDTVCQAVERPSCKLIKLYLIGGNWNGALHRILLTQTNLSRLHLVSVSELQPDTFAALSSLKLTVLLLEKCVLIAKTACVLAPLLSSHLTKLSLTHCALSNEALQPLTEHCTKLTVLGLRGMKTVTDASILRFVSVCRNLTFIDISECPLLTDSALSAIATHTRTKLERLYIHHNNNFTYSGVDDVAIRCINLDVLNCMDCTRIPALSIVHILKQCPKMCALYFGTSTLSPESVISVLQHCGGIFKLVINIPDASYDVLYALCKYCSAKLTDLGLHQARTLNGKGLFHLAKACVQLELFVHSPGAVDQFGRLMWGEMNPKLQFSTKSSDLDYNILIDL